MYKPVESGHKVLLVESRIGLIEGRISVLFRGRGMKRCLWSGRERFELFLAAAVLANNSLVLAARLQTRKNKSAPLRTAT